MSKYGLELRQGPGQSGGATLLVSLMILLVLMILGLSAANISTMQERMTGSYMDAHDAFQAAEDTLRGVEQALADGGTGGLGVIPSWTMDPDRLSYDCTLEDSYDGRWDDDDLWSNFAPTGGQFMIIDLLDQPACRPLEEDSGFPAGAHFLVVARGQGFGTGQRRSQAIVQTIFYWP